MACDVCGNNFIRFLFALDRMAWHIINKFINRDIYRLHLAAQ